METKDDNCVDLDTESVYDYDCEDIMYTSEQISHMSHHFNNGLAILKGYLEISINKGEPVSLERMEKMIRRIGLLEKYIRSAHKSQYNWRKL